MEGVESSEWGVHIGSLGPSQFAPHRAASAPGRVSQSRTRPGAIGPKPGILRPRPWHQCGRQPLADGRTRSQLCQLTQTGAAGPRPGAGRCTVGTVACGAACCRAAWGLGSGRAVSDRSDGHGGGVSAAARSACGRPGRPGPGPPRPTVRSLVTATAACHRRSPGTRH
eukprot:766564-Hanusia_phi.AAC.5